MADNGNCKLKLIHSLSLRRTPASPCSSPASPQALTGTHAVGPFHLWTTLAFFPLLTRVQCPPSSGHLHSLSICSELIFALFLVSLTLFTSAHFLRAFSPTRYFLPIEKVPTRQVCKYEEGWGSLRPSHEIKPLLSAQVTWPADGSKATGL